MTGVGQRVVLIGCGLIGAKRLQALPAGWTVAAVFDLDRERAEAVAKLHGTVAATSVDEALAASAGDALALVATSHESLASSASRALDLGLDVLVEKPGARSRAEFEPVVALAQERQALLRVGYNHRFHPSFVRVRELLPGLDAGPLMSIRARYGHGGRLGYEKEWRAQKERSGGGELLDQGSHLLDLARTFGGDLELRFSDLRTAFWDMEVEDNAYLAVETAGGALGWLHASWTEWKNTFSFEVSYRNLKFEVSGLGGSYGTERLTLFEMLPEMGPPRTTIWEFPGADASWRLEFDDVVNARAGHPSVGATGADALATLAIIEEAYDA